MKKVLTMLLTLATTFSSFAMDYTAKAKIVLTANSSSQTCNLYLIQSDALNTGVNDGYCSTIEMDERKVAFYAIFSGNNYQTFGTKDLGNMVFGLMTDASTEYTLTISGVAGTQTLTMYDAVEDKYFDLTEGATYTFTAAANATVADRFSIKAKPAEPAICHQKGNLIITGHQGAKVKVLDMADQVAIAEQTLATDDEVISLSSLTKGEMYQVIVDEGTPMLIRIQ